MEADLKEALSLEGRDKAFRDQIEMAKEFRERMREGGVEIRQNAFTIPLMSRLDGPVGALASRMRVVTIEREDA